MRNRKEDTIACGRITLTALGSPSERSLLLLFGVVGKLIGKAEGEGFLETAIG